LNFPIKHYWATDDPIANQKNVEVFLQYWKTSKGLISEKLSPKDFGAKAIEHFGFFKRQFRDTIWVKMLNDLERFHTADF
jgi:predicted alpha/beta hydrolase